MASGLFLGANELGNDPRAQGHDGLVHRTQRRGVRVHRTQRRGIRVHRTHRDGIRVHRTHRDGIRFHRTQRHGIWVQRAQKCAWFHRAQRPAAVVTEVMGNAGRSIDSGPGRMA